MRWILYFCLGVLISSCTVYSDEIEDVLRQAGKNRKELEKVLKHYAKNPADSLNLRAAEFLILNMPGKYSQYSEGQWNDAATVYYRWENLLNRPLALDEYDLSDPVRKDDLKYITADFLINNIELAFKVWREMPWGKDIPFDVFCEEILPYRVGNEPLENWRKKVLASFADFYLLFKNNESGITAVEACCMVNDKLPRFVLHEHFPPMNYSQLMATSRGSNNHKAALAVFVMRGLGIPVTVEITPLWPLFPSAGIVWNSVRDSFSVHISFLGTESNPGMFHGALLFNKSKVYRHIYADQQHIANDTSHIPPLLRHINNLMDVTPEYSSCSNISLSVLNDHKNQTGYAFLSTPDKMEWKAVAWGTYEADSIHFLSVGNHVIYLPVYYYNDIQTPVSYPFYLEGDGTCRIFRPDTIQTESLTLFSQPSFFWSANMKGGKFEGANQPDFSDAQTLYCIKTDPGPYFHTVSIQNHVRTYRYVRYITPEGDICVVSIIEFYDENNQKLHGSILGESSSGWFNSNTKSDKAFDDDVQTCTGARPGNAWTGLDLGNPKRIKKIRYLPFTDGSGIYEGHVYELFYWNEKGWNSVAKKMADSHLLHFKAPGNALFILKNCTIDKVISTPFFMDNGVQRW